MKCSAPITIKTPSFEGAYSHDSNDHQQNRMTPVRCGKCEGCLKSQINDWAFRLEQEARVSTYIHFVTLTYSPKYVPLSENVLPTLSKPDLQKFVKRLRKKYPKLKYFAVGEYGTKSYRPHYHLIMYNVNDADDIRQAWTLHKEEIGGVHIGDDVTNGAIPYTLKYIFKKGQVPAFEQDDRLPEFRLMSKKLGINYLTKATIKWHLTDFKNRQYVTTNNGIKIALPRYFREILLKINGKPRHWYTSDQATYMTRDDDDYRTLESRVQTRKNNQEKFRIKRNQEQRKKI